MACENPKWAWKSTLPQENGKHQLRFSYRTDREPDYRIPCGKCLACQATKRREWGIRMYHESLCHEKNSFLTLTYENNPGEISRQDIDVFIKRLKRRIGPIRYFLTGEYGDKTKRPHYHAVIFGQDFLGGAYDIDDQLYGNPILSNTRDDDSAAWIHGHASIGNLTIGSAMYVAGYVTKKSGDQDTFSSMSRRPPIGMQWVRDNHDNLRRLEKVVIDGREYPIPQVYLNWLEGVETFTHIKENLRENAKDYTDHELDGQAIIRKSHFKHRKAKI